MTMHPSLLRYHPFRFQSFLSRPEWKDASLPGTPFLTTREILPAESLKPGPHWPIDPVYGTNAIDDMRLASARMSDEGFNIFDFSRLTQLFENTSVDEIDLSLISPPMPCFYAHFGVDSSLPSPFPGIVIDGAYVTHGIQTMHGSMGMQCVLVTAQEEQTDHTNDRLSSILPAIAHACPIEFALTSSVPDNLAFCAADDWWEYASLWAPFLSKPVQVLFNSLCYLDYDERLVRMAYPDGTPERLARLSASPRSSEAKRATSKLEGLGFRRIYICGGSRSVATGSHGGISTATRHSHWRRGHWRHQPHGEGRRLRKLIWIMPTMVGHDEKPSPKVYIVRK